MSCDGSTAASPNSSNSGDEQLQTDDSSSEAPACNTEPNQGSFVSLVDFNCDCGNCAIYEYDDLLLDMCAPPVDTCGGNLVNCQQQGMCSEGAADAELPAGSSSAAQELPVSSSCSTQAAKGELRRSHVTTSCTQRSCATHHTSSGVVSLCSMKRGREKGLCCHSCCCCCALHAWHYDTPNCCRAVWIVRLRSVQVSMACSCSWTWPASLTSTAS